MNAAIPVERIRRLSPRQQSRLLERLGRRSDGGSEKEIAAYVVCRPGQNVSIENLKIALAAQLPDFMVPARFVFLKALPLNPNGKVDRNALPAPSAVTPTRANAMKPANETQARLAAIWADVLRVQQVGAEDNFFQLGGHSLLALQVMARVRESFKADLPLKTLFDCPTVAGLAEAVTKFLAQPASQSSRRIPRRAGTVASPINPGLAQGRFPQER